MTTPDAAAVTARVSRADAEALLAALSRPLALNLDAWTRGLDALYAPQPVAPKWPDRVWAVFSRPTGEVMSLHVVPQGGSDGYAVRLPARLVPADAVVLTREDAGRMRGHFKYYAAGGEGFAWARQCVAALDAALAASAPKPEPGR